MNFRTLDLNLLRVFAAVMVERNVTRAAAQLAKSQPAVSNALRRLREATGDELFITVVGGVLPTAQAEALWPEVRAALDSLRQAFDPQDFEPSRDERRFVLAMADATATVLMPALIGALVGRHARSDLHVTPLASRDPRSQLEHGGTDLALGFFPEVAAALASEGRRASIALEPLYACEYVCVMRRDHPLAALPALPLDAYCAAEHVRVSFAGRPRGFVDEALAALGRGRRIALTGGQFATAARVVHDSDLLSVLPRSFVAASGLDAGLAIRAAPFDVPKIEVGMLWHRRHERDPAQRWLRATVDEVVKGLGIGEPRGSPAPPRRERIADSA
jgi:DNA-binding transcriptional LysR family regulator